MIVRTLRAVFAALLYLCPAEFRQSYGTAMRGDFGDALHDASCAEGSAGAAMVAARAFGDVVATALRQHAATIGRDLLFAFRSVRKTPLFALMVIATLAIAIGANAAVFSIVRAVVLAPLPYPAADRLVAIEGVRDGVPFGLSLPDFGDLAAGTKTIAVMGAFSSEGATLTGYGEPRRVAGVTATAELFTVLGARPQLGRFFNALDERPGAAQAIVVSDFVWRTLLHRDVDIVGRPILLDGVPCRIIGVAPPGLRQPAFRRDFTRADYWRLLPMRSANLDAYNRGAHYFNAVGRLHDGTTVAAARADLDAIFRSLVRRYPQTDTHFGVHTGALTEAIVGNVRPVLYALFAAVAGVLLVACANVANLLLSRAATRERELAVRIALGATRGRIAAALLTETFAYAVAGGGAGLLIAFVVLRTFIALDPPGIPRVADVALDGTSVFYTCAVVMFCTFAAGVAPAFSVSMRDVSRAVKNAGGAATSRSGRRARGALVVTEIALTLALVIGAGLGVRSYATLTHEPLGFDSAGVTMIGPVQLPERTYGSDARQVGFYRAALARVAAVPGVEAASWNCCGPATHQSFELAFTIDGQYAAPGNEPSALVNSVSAGYFGVLRVPVLAGRAFMPRDGERAPNVVIVNVAFARRYFAGASPLGARIHWGADAGGRPSPVRTVVGIVADARSTFAQPQAPMIYLPDTQVPLNESYLLVRTANPSAIAAAVGAVASVDRGLPAPPAHPLFAALGADAATARLTAFTLTGMALVALCLSLAGVFAVVSYGVAQRTHEFGIRMALGARDRQIVRVVVAGAMQTAAIGITAGLGVAALGTRLIADRLYDTAPLDPLTFGGVTLLVGLATFLAALIPARRATRVDPVVALRYE